MVPYAAKNSEWVGYDSKESYETKVRVQLVVYLIRIHSVSEVLILDPLPVPSQ